MRWKMESPFAMELSRKIRDSCINFFQVPERYSEEQLAPTWWAMWTGQAMA